MNIEDDDFPDPDYGVFGDINCPVFIKPPLSAKDIAEIDRLRKRRDRETQISRDFNSHMIYLYNNK